IERPEQTQQKSAPSAAPKLMLMAAALALLAVGGWFVSRPTPAVQAVDEAGPASDTNHVRVQISTLPPDAELFLDGEPISNPFDGELAKDDVTHELAAKRDGFVDARRKMVLKTGQRIFINLSTVPTPSAAPP